MRGVRTRKNNGALREVRLLGICFGLLGFAPTGKEGAVVITKADVHDLIDKLDSAHDGGFVYVFHVFSSLSAD